MRPIINIVLCQHLTYGAARSSIAYQILDIKSKQLLIHRNFTKHTCSYQLHRQKRWKMFTPRNHTRTQQKGILSLTFTHWMVSRMSIKCVCIFKGKHFDILLINFTVAWWYYFKTTLLQQIQQSLYLANRTQLTPLIFPSISTSDGLPNGVVRDISLRSSKMSGSSSPVPPIIPICKHVFLF